MKYPRGTGISPITEMRYEYLLDAFEPYRETNNLLDIGCGDGHFLMAAKNRKWQVFGTEFTDDSVRIGEGKGIVMKQGPLQPGDFQDGFFDVITSFEVIEHMNEPRKDVERISAALRNKGLAYVTTPNFNSISRNMLGSRWSVIEYPEHLCYYTPRTLKRLFETNGFRATGISTSGISWKRLRSSNSSNASDEPLRELTEYNGFLNATKRGVNYLLDLAGKGDNLKGFFVKQKFSGIA